MGQKHTKVPTVEPKSNNQKMDTVTCYNCSGSQKGCELCETFGEGNGQLYKRYQHETILITGKNGSLTKYKPSPVKCQVCNDKKICKIVINSQSSEVPCSECMKEDYNIKRKNLEDKYTTYKE